MENYTDLINAIWEVLGGLFVIPSIVSIAKTKEVKGVNWSTIMFFFIWGLWNIYFYPHNGFILSFYGGVFLSILNFIWVLMLIKYSKK